MGYMADSRRDPGVSRAEFLRLTERVGILEKSSELQQHMLSGSFDPIEGVWVNGLLQNVKEMKDTGEKTAVTGRWNTGLIITSIALGFIGVATHSISWVDIWRFVTSAHP
jgi:hypothetical protein